MSRLALVIQMPIDRERMAELAWKIADGSRVEIKAPKRSDDQNAKMWSMLGEVSKQVRHHTIELMPEDWKILFLDALHRETRMVPNLGGNGLVSLGRSSSDLSVAEMRDLIELIYEFGARHEVTFREPKARAA